MNKTKNNSWSKNKKGKTIIKKDKSNPKNARNINKDDTFDINNNSVKTIAVNKSKLFSPSKGLTIKRKIYNKYNNPQQMKNMLMNSNKQSKEYNTTTIDNQKRRENKKKPIKKRFFANHRKANSIQFLDNSLKKLNNNSKNEKCFSNSKINGSNNLFSVLRKIIEIKNKNLNKNTPQPNNSKKYKKINDENLANTINYTIAPYADKKKAM